MPISEDTIESMQTQAKDAGAALCVFPRLSNSPTGATEYHQTKELNIRHSDVLEVLERENIAAWSFVAAVWAVVVRTFVETECLHLWLCDAPEAVSDNDVNSLTQLLAIPLRDCSTMRHMCCTQNWSLVRPKKPGVGNSNIGITFDSGVSFDTLALSNNSVIDELIVGCDIVLCVRLADHKLRLSVGYNESVLSHTMAQSLASTIEQAIITTTQHFDEEFRGLSFCSDFNLAQIKLWNDREICTPPELPWWHRLQALAKGMSDKAAIDGWDGRLSFRELDELSWRVAWCLQASGIGPTMMIPVCFEKSIWAIIAAIGVQKTGAAFVPLDPTHPIDRLKEIVKAVDTNVVVTSSRYARLLGDETRSHIISTEALAGFPPPAEQVFPTLDMNSPAYCLFTSGSTGKPKGCVVDHAALAGITKQSGRLHLSERSRVLQFASYSFGISIIEIYSTLSAGGTVCVPSDQDRASIDGLTNFITRMSVNWIKMTPTMLGSIQPQAVPTLETVFTGGEPLQRSQIAEWGNKVALHPSYGFTEWAGVCCVSERVMASSSGSVTIGRPVCGKAWLVNPANHAHLAPIGSVAELFIEGPCLAQGYLDDSERTSAAFCVRPAWLAGLDQHEEGRMYRTGDLVRYISEGNLVFVGRNDSQLKIRGQRVELAEVEIHLKQCFPGSARIAADVISLRDNQGQQSLTAFVQQSSSPEGPEGMSWIAPSNAEFQMQSQRAKETLDSKLPRYMIPDMFILVHRLPLTISGKIDRFKLRSETNNFSRPELLNILGIESGRVPPSTETEARLVNLVAEALIIPANTTGANHNFFHLGGDSIQAMKLMGLARKQGLKLTLTDIFQHPIISEMALVVSPTEQTVDEILEPFALVQTSTKQTIIEMAAEQCAVPKSYIEDIYPCSALQAGLFALSMQKDGSYITQSVYTLRPGIEVSRLKSAWETVFEQNEVLRTRFIQSDSGEICQVVVNGPLEWEIAENKDEYLNNSQRLRASLGSPLLQSCIIPSASSSDESYFMVTMHHSICDRWVLGLNLGHLEAAYRDEVVQRAPFKQFIHYLSNTGADEEFWRARFQGIAAVPFPALPSAGFKPTPDQTHEFEMRIPILAKGNFTFSTAVQMAWALVISRHTSTDDVVFGLTLTGRSANVDGIESMAGPTIATVPIRIQIHPEATIEQALHTHQEQMTKMVPYEQTGLQRMRTFSPEAKQACGFQNHLVIQSPWDSEGTGLFSNRTESEAVAGGFANSPLVVTCQLTKDPQHVSVSARFDERVLSKDEVQRLFWSLEATLSSFFADISRPLRDISTLGSQEIEQLVQWNPAPTYSRSSVVELIRQNCIKFPSMPAVDAWDGQFTYEDLDRLSSSLAKHLIGRGVKPRSYVPIYSEKSKWAVVSMFAVIKSGAAFLLLDPFHPLKRLKENCSLAQGSLIIASPTNVRLALELSFGVVVSSGEYSSWVDERDIEFPEVSADDPLYTVCTSGSTGKPKGVMIDHLTFLAAAFPTIEGLGIDTSTRWLQFCSYAFDVATVEQLWVLVGGGCLCIPTDKQRLDGIAEAAALFKPTHTMLTPTFAYTLNSDDLSSLQVLILCGEAMQAKDIQKWAHRLRLVNSYGPSETGSTYKNFHVKPNSIPGRVGRSMGGRSWLVNPDDVEKLVPIGAVGELLMNGPNVGLGYLRDPEKTAASFISAPSWLEGLNRSAAHPTSPQDPMCRLYKTGDLFRYDHDGILCYVGRKDTQVKLRGQRVELGEIEYHVQAIFKDCLNIVAEAVTPTNDQTNPFIVAFIHSSSHESDAPDNYFSLASTEFRKRCATASTELRDRIPAYMVPSLMIPVSRLPRTATGKIDRKGLREAVLDMSNSKRGEYRMMTDERKQPPTTEAERKMHAIWAKVLRLEPSQVGIDDNFFHLGGDSISAMHMAAKARDEGLAISVTTVLENPKLSTLANLELDMPIDVDFEAVPFSLLDEETRASATERAVCLGLASDVSQIADILPVTEGQSFLLTQWTPVYHCHYIDGQVDVDKLRAACRGVVSNHSILRTAFLRNTGNPLQVILKGLDVPFRHIDTKENLSIYCDRIAQSDNQISSTVDTAPLQFSLVSNTSTKHVFVIRISHAQYDGLSMPVLLNDLASDYSGVETATALDFSSYMYFRSSRTNDKAFSFWRQYLQGSSIATIKLPTEVVIPKSQTADGRVSAGKNMPLPTAPRGITTASLVKAACAFVFARISSQMDLVLGQTVNGRSLPLPGIDKVLGPCLTSIPFRVKMQKGWKIQDLLQHVQTQCVSTLAYDYLDSAEIFKKSTDWSADTRFSCVIQHQNLERTPGIQLAGTQTSFAGWAHFVPSSGMWIMSSPNESSMGVMLCSSEDVMSAATARSLVEQICHTIELFAGSPDRSLDFDGSGNL